MHFICRRNLLGICRIIQSSHQNVLCCSKSTASATNTSADINDDAADEEWKTTVNQIKSTTESLAARGFCRARKSYNPPEDVENVVQRITKSILGSENQNWKKTQLRDPQFKFKLLTTCMKEIQHEVPNSMMHSIQTVEDLVAFFKTPVEGLSPYDKLFNSKDELPKNLHVQPHPVRFSLDKDSFFKGLTAFPGTACIVSGLKTKKKFKGHVGRISWDRV